MKVLQKFNCNNLKICIRKVHHIYIENVWDRSFRIPPQHSATWMVNMLFQYREFQSVRIGCVITVSSDVTVMTSHGTWLLQIKSYTSDSVKIVAPKCLNQGYNCQILGN